MKTSILQLFLERLDHGIAQLLRGYFCGDLCVIVLGVIISPFVVFIPADLSDAQDQMLWVQRMNSIRNQAMEVVNNDLIYA